MIRDKQTDVIDRNNLRSQLTNYPTLCFDLIFRVFSQIEENQRQIGDWTVILHFGKYSNNTFLLIKLNLNDSNSL